MYGHYVPSQEEALLVEMLHGGGGGYVPGPMMVQPAPQMPQMPQHDGPEVAGMVGAYYGVYGQPQPQFVPQQHGELGYYDIQGEPVQGPTPQMAWYPAVGQAPAQQGPYAGRGAIPYPDRASPAMLPLSPQPPGALTVVKRDPTTSRVLFVGVQTDADVVAGTTATATTRPTDTVAARKVIVPPTIAPSFNINDVKVGPNSQFGSDDPVPAETFIPDSMTADVRFDTAQLSQPISFIVDNIGAADVRFRAAMNCFVIRL